MKNRLNKWITRLAGFIEIAVSILILIAILLASVSLVQEMFSDGTLLTVDTFEVFLGHALALVIGLEFIKMLIKHTPGAAIEVLLYAIARQLIVYHTTTLETLIGILAVAGVFAIRKFLFVHAFEEKEETEKEKTKRKRKDAAFAQTGQASEETEKDERM